MVDRPPWVRKIGTAINAQTTRNSGMLQRFIFHRPQYAYNPSRLFTSIKKVYNPGTTTNCPMERTAREVPITKNSMQRTLIDGGRETFI
jgi:hypothetical protein